MMLLAQVEGAIKLSEYGPVGILMLVIVATMSSLLVFVLSQVREDRKEWIRQADRFLASMCEITKQQAEMTRQQADTASLIKEIKEDLTRLRHDFEEDKK